MTDHKLLVKELLEEQVPLRLEAQPDWSEVLLRAGIDRSAGSRSGPEAEVMGEAKPPARTRLTGWVGARAWRRRVLVPTLIVFTLVVTGIAVAAALGELPWWEGAPPPVEPAVVDSYLGGDQGEDAEGRPLPRPDRSRARTVAQADGAALVAAPVGKDGYCLIPSLSDAPSLGGSCAYQADDEIHSYRRPESPFDGRWIVYGRIVDPKAATLDLSEAAGAQFRIPLRRGGFFIANVPKERWNALNNQAGKGKILDQSGATLRTGCVDWGLAPGSLGDSIYGVELPFWHEGGGPCHHERYPGMFDVAGATKLVELTLTEQTPEKYETIAIWRAPQQDGTVCVFKALAAPRPNPPPALWDNTPSENSENPAEGLICGAAESVEQTPGGTPIAVSFKSGGAWHGFTSWLIYGHVDPDKGIASLELLSGTGRRTIAYGHGWFLAELPLSDSWRELPPGGPYVLTGYDNEGNEVARVDLKKTWEAQQPK